MASISKNRSQHWTQTIITTLTSFFIIMIVSAKTHDDRLITMELIHRDHSPKSPFYVASQTPWQRIAQALKRSHHRAKTYSSQLPQSTLFPSGGEYLINISLGTPPRPLVAIADTGSDLIWTQCSPCNLCFKQKLPLFDTKASSTYKPLSCSSQSEEHRCRSLGQDFSCDPKTRLCRYNFTYADDSFSAGDVAGETLSMASSSGESSIRFPGAEFGCGFRNGGVWSGDESGVVGLGSGELSLVSQMGPTINGRFSYCLVPMSSFHHPKQISSKIAFGGSGLVPGHLGGFLSTPLLFYGKENYYYVWLRGVSVGHKRFELESSEISMAGFKGNIIVDSGTTLTFLPGKVYGEMEREVRRGVRHLRLAEDPSKTMRLCYETRAEVVGAPALTFHFDGGADVELREWNVFLRTGEDVVCFAFAPTDDVLVFGNVAQTDFLVEYDLKNKVLALKPTDCTRYK